MPLSNFEEKARTPVIRLPETAWCDVHGSAMFDSRHRIAPRMMFGVV
jgi:hypothetical protein